MALRLTWPAAWVSHDRQDIGGELRRLRLTGMRSTAPVGRASYLSPTSLTGRQDRRWCTLSRAPLFLYPCQSRTALPQCQSSAIVQRRCRWRGRTTLVEVFSGHIGHLWRGREIDDRLSAFSGGYCEKLSEPSEAGDQTAAFIGEACRYETRMQTIRGHADIMNAPSKFSRKQNVAKLRATISLRGSEAIRGSSVAR